MIDYAEILDQAHAAARDAVAKATKEFDEMKGACGFAWVTIPGNDALARFCRRQLKAFQTDQVRAQHAQRYGDKGYPVGWQFWNPGNHPGQRIDIKEAGARAFRDALATHGIRADVGSRLD